MKTAVFAIAGIAFASLVAIGSTPAAAAEAYPAKPIHMMLGFDPGASTDITARVLARKLSAQLNVPILVENKPGAGGIYVMELGAKAAPDGYTLIFNSGSMAQSYGA